MYICVYKYIHIYVYIYTYTYTGPAVPGVLRIGPNLIRARSPFTGKFSFNLNIY